MQSEYEEILYRYKNPNNFGRIENPDAHFKDSNPLCGDEVEVFLRIENNTIEDMKFIGAGCSISKASTDILADYLIGKEVEEVLEISNNEVLNLININISPMRLKCALLGLVTVKKSIEEWKNDTNN